MAGSGNTAALEELIERHNRRIYCLCLRMLRTPQEAEDLRQEVYIQLYRKVNQFRGDSAFTTWLHRLTVNQVLMYLRKRSVKMEETIGDSHDFEMHNRKVVRANLQSFPIVDKIALDHAVKQLPKGYKSVFILHDVEGHEHEEVARILGCSVGTSKSQLHKARMKLRKLLKKRHRPN